MGEMADYYLDSDFVDYDGYDQAGRACKYCKRGPFWWLEDSFGQWRLVTYKGNTHYCGAYFKHVHD